MNLVRGTGRNNGRVTGQYFRRGNGAERQIATVFLAIPGRVDDYRHTLGLRRESRQVGLHGLEVRNRLSELLPLCRILDRHLGAPLEDGRHRHCAGQRGAPTQHVLQRGKARVTVTDGLRKDIAHTRGVNGLTRDVGGEPLQSQIGDIHRRDARHTADLKRDDDRTRGLDPPQCLDVLGIQGTITTVLRDAAGIDIYSGGVWLYKLPGLVLPYLYFQIPLMIIVFTPALRILKTQWAEANLTLGGTRWTFWRRVAAPVLFPSLLGSFLLLFANAFSSYSTAAALINQTSPIAPLQIRQALSSETVLGRANMASAVAVAMMVVMVVCMSLYALVQRRSSRWRQ